MLRRLAWRAVALATIGLWIGLSAPAAAQTTYKWSGANNGTWSTGGNWSPSAPDSANGSGSILFFDGTSSFTATNDVANFQLNQLWVNAATGTTITLNSSGGGSLQFVGTDPQLLQMGAGALVVSNDISISSRWTIAGAGTGDVTLNNAISGTGGLVVNGSGTVTLKGSNSYTGGTFVRSGTLSYIADGALGDSAGSVSLQGGTLRFNSPDGGSTPSRNFIIDAASTFEVSSAQAVSSSGSWSGAGTLTKSGAQTLELVPAVTNTMFGGVVITAGTLQTNGLTGAAALRMNSLNIGGSATFTHAGTAADIRFGELSGSGTFNIGTNKGYLLALNDTTFSGAVTLGSSSGGLTVRGTGTQTLSGSTTLDGELTVGSKAGLTLSGSAVATASTASLTLGPGTLTLDNSGGNTGSGATTSRLRDSGAVKGFGGTLVLLGNATNGSSETSGVLTINSGATTISVTHNGGSAGTELVLSSLARNNNATLNIVGSGGTLGSSGANPRVTFATAPSTVNNVIANSGSSTILGYVTVNGTDFASSGANGIVAVSTTDVSGALTSAGTTNARLTGNGSFSSSVSYNTLKIEPSSSGQSLDLTGSGNLITAGIMLVGSNDFTIQNTGAGTGKIGYGDKRFIYVANADTTLTVSVLATGASQSLVKGGAGFLALTSSSAQIPTAIHTINNGVLRASMTNFPNGTGLLEFRGGVLEITGGSNGSGSSADFRRTLGTSTSGGVNWNTSSAGTNQGSGGFSASGSAASVNIDGNSTPSILTWGLSTSNFVQEGYALLFGSSKADSRIRLLNSIALGGTTSLYNAREIRVFDNTNSSGDIAEINGAITGNAATDLLKTGAGTLELTGTNTYSGNTIVAAGTLIHNYSGASQTGSFLVKSGATLQLGSGSTISTTGTLALQGGTLDVNGISPTLGTLAFTSGGSITNSGAAALISTNNNLLTASGLGSIVGTITLNLTSGVTSDVIVTSGTLTLNGPIGQSASGARLNKSGAGILDLKAAGSYSGTTTINGGTLLANNATTAATGTGAITINSGTLGGVRVGGSITVNGGGVISPGNSIDTLATSSGLTVQKYGRVLIEIGGLNDNSSSRDALSVAGTMNLVSGAVIDVRQSGSPGFAGGNTYQYTIAAAGSPIQVDGSTSGSLSGISIDSSNFSTAGAFSLSRSGNSLQLSFQPVPEPTTVLSVFLAGAGLAHWWRKRKQVVRSDASGAAV